MTGFLMKLQNELWDWASNSPLVRNVRYAAARLKQGTGSGDLKRQFASALSAARTAYDSARRDTAIARLRGVFEDIRTLDLGALRALDTPTTSTSIEHCAILKLPTPGERGVLVVCFEHNFQRLLHSADLAALRADYRLVLSPTWSPPFDASIMLLAAAWKEPLVTMLSNFEDRAIYPAFVPSLVVTPLLASSWVHRAYMAPRREPRERPVDIVMFANFSRYKRHIALFKALRRLPSHLTVRLVGVALDGRDQAFMRRLLDAYGVKQQVEIVQNAPREQLASLLDECKIAVIPSMREGSCIAVAELMMLNIPVLMLDGAHVGSTAFVNEHSGRIVPEPTLATAIADVLSRLDQFSPRSALIASGHDSAGSTRVLNETLATMARAEGTPWTVDCVEHTVVQLRPYYTTHADADRFRAACAAFASRYGVSLPEPSVVPLG